MSVIVEPGLSVPDRPVLFHRWATFTAVTANASAPGFPATNAGNLRTDERWTSGLSAERNLLFTLDPAVPVNCISVGAHNGAETNARFRIGYTVAGGSNVILSSVNIVPTDNGPLIWLLQTRTLEAIRVYVTNAPFVGVVRAGLYDQMTQRAAYVGSVPVGTPTGGEVTPNLSRSGQYLGVTRDRTSAEFSFDVEHLSEAHRRDVLQPFLNHANSGQPFFAAPRPVGYPLETVYGWRGGRDLVATRMMARESHAFRVSIGGVGHVE